MSDLEILSLQATGSSSWRKNQSRHPQSWPRGGAGDGEPNNDDVSSFMARKRRQVFLKKRVGGGGDCKFTDDYSHGVSSIRSGHYKGGLAEEELCKMTEPERKMIAERGTKMDNLTLRTKVQVVQKIRKESHVPPVRRRSAALFENKTTAKAGALNVIRGKQFKQGYPEGCRRFRDAVVAIAADSSRAAPMDDDDNKSGKGGDGKKSEDDDGFPKETKGGNDMDDESIKYEDVKGITIRRSKLGKWLLKPFFEEMITGCFVRLSVGKSRSGIVVYKLCLVKNVDSTDKGLSYKLEGQRTNKYLNLVWGAESTAARWSMDVVSDSPPAKDEFKLWLQAVESSGGRMPTRDDILDKKEAITKIKTFGYSAASMQPTLPVKKSASSRPLNAAAEKDRLKKKMEVAQLNRDEVEIERIRARLKELEDMYLQSKEKNLKALRLAEMNKRNRAENFKNALEMKPLNTSLKAGEAGYDRFSGRWTRSTNYYVSKAAAEAGRSVSENNAEGAGVGSGELNGDGPVNGLKAGVAVTAAALEAAEGAGKLVDTRAPVHRGTKFNSVHDFELPISLSGLQKFGGAAGSVAGYLSRKAKIEATIGYKVPENDGKQHAVTLTISDYKRRMGLK